MSSLSDHLAQGLKFHRAGDLDRAEKEYRRALKLSPQHGEALHLMGFLEQQRGRPEQAARFLKEAADASPRNAIYQSNLGAAYKLLGRLKDAADCFRKALTLSPDYSDAHYNLAVSLDALGDKAGAIDSYREALRCNPTSVETLNNLGNALGAEGDLQQAEEVFQKSLDLRYENAQTHFNLGNILMLQGRVDEAMARYDSALQTQPDYSEVHFNTGIGHLKRNRLAAAADCFQRTTELSPDNFDAWNNLGIVRSAEGSHVEAIPALVRALSLRPNAQETAHLLGLSYAALGSWDQAIAAYRKALSIQPEFVAAHNNLGLALQATRQLDAARQSFEKALRLNPELVEAHYNLANILRIQGEFNESRKHYELCLQRKPDFANAHLNLGTVYESLGQPETAARYFRTAAEFDPHSADPLTNLGLMAKADGQIEAALSYFDQSLQRKPQPIVRLFRDTLLPPIYDSQADLTQWRTDFQSRLQKLLSEDQLRIRPDVDLMPSVFYLPYQGQNDLSLQSDLARLYARARGGYEDRVPEQVRRRSQAAASSAGSTAEAPAKIRIGFISRFFWNHTIGRLMQGLISQLDRKRFEVIVFSLQSRHDDIGQRLQRDADQFVALPNDLPLIKNRIAEQELDLLYFPDIGMDPLTWSLAFTRLAPVQCVSWGHPVTTGIETIDYFISADSIEPADANTHYSEQLVRLPHLPVCYERPKLPAQRKRRADFGLSDAAHLYVCPQSLFKFHPDFDPLLQQILQQDPQGEIVLISARNPNWNDQLRARFSRTMPDVANRIRFLPAQPHEDFLSLLSVCDVMLDPLHFGGGNTSFEALGLGLPIVTLPGPFMRGRVTSGCYQQMGLSDLIATSTDDFVARSVRLGSDVAYNMATRSRILVSQAQLFDNPAGVRDLEQFFEQAVRQAGRPSDVANASTAGGSSTATVDLPAAVISPAALHKRSSQVERSAEPTPSHSIAAARQATTTHSSSTTPPLAEILRSCTCPACGYHVAVPFFDGGQLPLTTLAWPETPEQARAMKRLPHDFLRCVDCGHVYNAQFNYSEVPYSEKPNLMFNRGILWREHLQAVRDLILSRLPARPLVVEVGCGEGHLLRALAEKRPAGRYIGFDPNGAIDTGDGRIEGRQELFEPQRHLAELKPDLIISRHVLEHLMNPLGFVQALSFAASWEQAPAQLFIEVPCIDGVFQSGRTVDFFYEHNSHFTVQSLTRLLERCSSGVDLVQTGYSGEVVYGLATFRQRSDQTRIARDALSFRDRAQASRETVSADLNRLLATGQTIAIWGGTGKAAAFINQHGLDADRFPFVVDSDPDKAGTCVPGTGQRIEYRDELLTRPVDIVLIATQWRAQDIVLEMQRAGIRCQTILIEHGGRLVNYLTDEHPYSTPKQAA